MNDSDKITIHTSVEQFVPPCYSIHTVKHFFVIDESTIQFFAF